MPYRNYIYYGDGDIKIEHSDSILGFDIIFTGTYRLESYNPEGFIISYNNGRLIGIGLGVELGDNPILKYTGYLEIVECKIVNSDMKIVNVSPKLVRLDLFQATIDDFDGSNTNFEDMNNVGIVGNIPNKTKVNIITKNLNTKGEEYLFNGKDYIGDYHLHHTGVAMTGSEHTKNSQILEIKDKIDRIKRISKTIRTIRTTSTRGGGY